VWNEQGRISVRNICVNYEENKVVKNLSLEIGYGDKVAIIGSNGSGKSTLLKTFLKINEPNCGEIWFNNQSICEISAQNLRHLFSFLPASLLLFTSTSEENINMNEYQDYSNEELQSILRNASFGDDDIENILQTKTSELSGGQAQRVAFGRAIASKKSIYLLDEPTSALDEENSKNVMEYVFNNLNTYIYTTHNAREITYSNRVIYIESGIIVCDLPKEEFLQSDYYFMWLGKNTENGV
jgi:ATP-binding cassette subfamily C protein CydC